MATINSVSVDNLLDIFEFVAEPKIIGAVCRSWREWQSLRPIIWLRKISFWCGTSWPPKLSCLVTFTQMICGIKVGIIKSSLSDPMILAYRSLLCQFSHNGELLVRPQEAIWYSDLCYMSAETAAVYRDMGYQIHVAQGWAVKTILCAHNQITIQQSVTDINAQPLWITIQFLATCPDACVIVDQLINDDVLAYWIEHHKLHPDLDKIPTRYMNMLQSRLDIYTKPFVGDWYGSSPRAGPRSFKLMREMGGPLDNISWADLNHQSLTETEIDELIDMGYLAHQMVTYGASIEKKVMKAAMMLTHLTPGGLHFAATLGPKLCGVLCRELLAQRQNDVVLPYAHIL